MKRPVIRDDGPGHLLRIMERRPDRRREVIRVCRVFQRTRDRIIRQAKRDGYFQNWSNGLPSLDDHPVVRARNEHKAVADYGRWLEKQPVQEDMFA